MEPTPALSAPEEKSQPARDPAIAAPGIVPDGTEDDLSKLPKTKGEWFYDGVQQIGGKGAIIAATAVFGFLAKYGSRWYGPVPNVFKIFNDWFGKKVVSNPLYTIPEGQKYEVWRRLVGAAASTMVLFHGGNVFAPIMKKLENNRENIANWYNKRWGKPGDVEIAHERLKDEPQQNWGDVIKGRLVAWGIIFGAMASIDFVLGKGRLFGKGGTDKYRFDQYEEGFGRWLAGFTKKGKELWNTPLSKELTDLQKQNKVYQFGRITALDFYATNVGIIIWSFFSRKSARKRQDHQGSLQDDAHAGSKEGMETKEFSTTPAETAPCRPCRYKPSARSLSPSGSFAETVAGEKARASEIPVGMGA